MVVGLPYRTYGSMSVSGSEWPRLVATTSHTPRITRSSRSSSSDSSYELNSISSEDGTTIFRNARWSPDGTTILTASEDRGLRSFILPPNLLDSDSPHAITPYSLHRFPASIYATAMHPSFTLSSPATAVYLASSASLPIRLLSPFAPSIIASYPLIHGPTEAYLAPHSLLFSSSNSNHFLAGTDSLIAQFDSSRPSSPPIATLPTIPSKRKTIVGGGVGMKGIVSALALNSDGVLAAGTFTGWLGLYGGEGVGDMLAVFPLRSPKSIDDGVTVGQGVTSIAWSSCGRYLVVAERGSDGMGVWDIRETGTRLAWLKGRKAVTMQRLGFTIVGSNMTPLSSADDAPRSTNEAESVWAGGTDGQIRAWADLGRKEGVIEPSWSFSAHGEAVSAVDIHPYASVLASCSGARQHRSMEDERTGEEESDGGTESVSGNEVSTQRTQDRSLRIWSL